MAGVNGGGGGGRGQTLVMANGSTSARNGPPSASHPRGTYWFMPPRGGRRGQQRISAQIKSRLNNPTAGKVGDLVHRRGLCANRVKEFGMLELILEGARW